MSFQETYKTMIDGSFGHYYEVFRQKGAISKETALTMEELFDGKKLSAPEKQLFRKMLSFGVVKRAGKTQYWLDEQKAANPGNMMRQRMVIIGFAALFVLIYCIVNGG